ncbi:complement component C6 [Pelodytes ibericus]
MDYFGYFIFIIISSAVGNTSACFCEHYPWGSWTSCSKTCEGGSQSRDRNIVYNDYYTKNNCDQLCTKHETRSCNEQGCPISCRLGDFGSWSVCDPCLKKQFRTRTLERAAQFGGQPCSGQLVDSRQCIPTKICNIQDSDCDRKFKCNTGRCIALNLRCNGDNDCGDNSDERNCRKKIEPTRSFESIPGVQLMGNGFNYLSGESRGEVLGNNFYGGKLVTVSGNGTGPNRKLYRLPTNVESIVFKVENEEDDVASDFYNSLKDFSNKMNTQNSHSHSGKRSSGIPFLFHSKSNSRITSASTFREAIQASQSKTSNFIRINKVVSVSKFTMTKKDLWLSDVFLKALNHLPLEYNYALYSRIFDDFGTHYITAGSMGGSYDLLYQFSSENLKNSGLTESESVECVKTETVRRILFWKKKTVREICTTNKMSERYEGSFLQSSEKAISLVKGGRAEFAAKLAWQKDGRFPEENVFGDWVSSTVDNPTLIEYQLSPIIELVTGFPCAVTKRRNLLKAFDTYLDRFDPCMCLPCPNNAKVVLSDKECLCICEAGTYGKSCEKRSPDYNSVVVDGSWSCWASWSSCDASLTRTRKRECNNPSPRNGGKPCEGEQTEEGRCYISLMEDKGALCINDDEEKKEIDQEPPEHDSGCGKPDPPENGFFINEKNWYSVAEELEIVCIAGYALSGYQFLRCLPDGTWKQEDVECLKTTCPRPSVSEDITIISFKTEYKVGETIQMTCPQGFIVTGKTFYQCGSDFTWKPPILRQLSCEKEAPTVLQGKCNPGQKQVGSECVCMSPEQDCRHYTEDLCIFDAHNDKEVNLPRCQYLAEKCLGTKELHFVDSGPCKDINLDWVRARISLAANSVKKEPCGYDFCYDWERCLGTECSCITPSQCPQNDVQQYCIKAGISGIRKTASHCFLAAIKCRNIKHEILSNSACTK